MVTNKDIFFHEFCRKWSDPQLEREDAVKIWKWVQEYKRREVAKAKVDMIRWVRANALGFNESRQKLIIKNKLEELRKRE